MQGCCFTLAVSDMPKLALNCWNLDDSCRIAKLYLQLGYKVMPFQFPRLPQYGLNFYGHFTFSTLEKKIKPWNILAMVTQRNRHAHTMLHGTAWLATWFPFLLSFLYTHAHTHKKKRKSVQYQQHQRGKASSIPVRNASVGSSFCSLKSWNFSGHSRFY